MLDFLGQVSIASLKQTVRLILSSVVGSAIIVTALSAS